MVEYNYHMMYTTCRGESMRNIVIIMVVVVMVGSCSIQGAGMLDVPMFDNPEEAMMWIHENIEYATDRSRGYLEYWQSPEQTLYYRTGDCEDMSILFADIVKTQFNLEAKLVVVYIKGYGFHMLNWLDGKYFDVTNLMVMNLIPSNWKIVIQDTYL